MIFQKVKNNISIRVKIILLFLLLTIIFNGRTKMDITIGILTIRKKKGL